MASIEGECDKRFEGVRKAFADNLEGRGELEPFWQPGTKHGYHAITIGWLVGEVIRRISGKGLGTYFRTEIAEPLGLDAHIGLDAKHDARVTDILPAPPPEPGMPNLFEEAAKDPKGPTAAAFMNPPVLTKPAVP